MEFIDKTTLLAEKADALRQRDEAQARLAQAQQVAQQANNDIVGYSYAAKQCDALLAMIEKGPDEAPSTAPTP